MTFGLYLRNSALKEENFKQMLFFTKLILSLITVKNLLAVFSSFVFGIRRHDGFFFVMNFGHRHARSGNPNTSRQYAFI